MRILVGLINSELAGGIYVAERGFLDECAAHKNVQIKTFGFGSRSASEGRIRRVFRLLVDVMEYAWLLAREKPDIVHVNSAYDRRALLRDVWYAMISAIFRRRLFIKFHGSNAGLLQSTSRWWRLLTRITMRHAAAVGVLSMEEKTNFARAGHNPGKIVVVKNAVDWRRFADDSEPKTERPSVLFIARFIPAKGLLDVIRAVKIVVDSGRDVLLRCVGSGPELEAATALVQALGLERNVRFEGFVPETEATHFYLSSTMLVLPTYHDEGFSMTVFQSVAAGLPIITTKIRGSADYLKEPENCLWVEPKNPQMIAEKIIQLLDDAALCASMAQHNRALARAFDVAQVAREYLIVYERIIHPLRMLRSVLMGMPKKGLPGGPQGHLPLLVKGLRATGLQVNEELYGSPVSRQFTLRRIFWVLMTADRFHRAVRRQRYDIVQLNTAFDVKGLLRDLVTVFALRRAGARRIFLKFHGTDVALVLTSNPIMRKMSSILFRSVDGIGVLSQEERTNFCKTTIDGHKLFVVKNIVDASIYRRDPGFRARQGIAPETHILLFVSRFIPAKGLIDTIRACRIVADRGLDFVLLCLGDGPERGRAEAEVRRLDLTRYVRFYGYIPEEETRDFYANSTMLVFPTFHEEGCSMAILQSVIAGLPVITTKIRASADYFHEPDNCLWVEPRNPTMLAEKIMHLSLHPELREQMSCNNEKLKQLFSAEHVSAEFRQLYEMLLKRADGRAVKQYAKEW